LHHSHDGFSVTAGRDIVKKIGVPEASAVSQGFGVKLVRRGSDFSDFQGRE
jgi:hypothetical protein